MLAEERARSKFVEPPAAMSIHVKRAFLQPPDQTGTIGQPTIWSRFLFWPIFTANTDKNKTKMRHMSKGLPSDVPRLQL